MRDLADSVNYIDPIYIDENDLMGGDDFEEVDVPRSSTTEKESSVEKKETPTERKTETKTETKQESKSESKSSTTDSKSAKP